MTFRIRCRLVTFRSRLSYPVSWLYMSARGGVEKGRMALRVLHQKAAEEFMSDSGVGNMEIRRGRWGKGGVLTTDNYSYGDFFPRPWACLG